MKISSIDKKNIILDKRLSLHLELHITLLSKEVEFKLAARLFPIFLDSLEPRFK
jgi:hypothetical protein